VINVDDRSLSLDEDTLVGIEFENEIRSALNLLATVGNEINLVSWRTSLDLANLLSLAPFIIVRASDLEALSEGRNPLEV